MACGQVYNCGLWLLRYGYCIRGSCAAEQTCINTSVSSDRAKFREDLHREPKFIEYFQAAYANRAAFSCFQVPYSEKWALCYRHLTIMA